MAILRRVTKTTGKVHYQVMIDRRDPLTGKRGRVVVGTFRTRREAEAAERQAMTERDKGTLLDPSKATVGDVLTEWLAIEAPKTVRPENLTAYEITVRKHLLPRFGNVPLRSLSVEMVERFYADLQAAGYSPSHIRKCHLRLSAALKMAVRWGIVGRNVCEVARPPKLTYKRPQVWTPDEIAAFLRVAERDGMHPYWWTAIETGARTSELLGLAWDDFDPERGTLRIGGRVVRLLKGTPVIKEGAKSAAGQRTIRLSAELLAELRAHRVRWLEKRLAAGPAWENPHNLVFCTASGRPINPRHVRRSFDRLVAQAGVTPISPHGLRKTNITLAIAGGANVKAIAARVGHADPSTTIGIYTALTAGMEEQALDVIERVLPRRTEQSAS